MKKTKLSSAFWTALIMFSLMGQIAWVVENMYLNVFIYKMFNASAGDISAMVSASAVSAALTTLFMGALSDRVGKRKLFMCGGYIAWGISILGFALLKVETINSLLPGVASAAGLGVSLTIVMDCVMTFFGSTANDAAFNAWLTDSTDSTNRGAAEGINAMMPLVAILAVFGGFMAFDLDSAESWVSIFCIIGGVTLAIGIVGIFVVKDSVAGTAEKDFWKNVVFGFRPSTVRANGGLYKLLLGFVVFNISIQIFMPYLILYYEVSLKMSNYVFIMAPAIIIASAVTAFWGRFYDKKGFTLSCVISLLWLCGGYLLLFFFRRTAAVFAGSLLMMCGYLSGMAVFGAAIRDSIPDGRAGSFQGVRIFAQVLLPGVIGPYIGKLVLANAETVLNSDGTSSFVPNRGIFMAALCAIVVLWAIFPLINKPKTRKTVSLKTPYETEDGQLPWSQYPRPQMVRRSYICLNGSWELFAEKKGTLRSLGTVTVPFPPESDASGVGYTPEKGEILVYRRSFCPPETGAGDRVMINFGASDQETEVFVNGNKAGENLGGYLPFSFDITEFLKPGENALEVRVKDDLDTDLPYGKQCRSPKGMWYTPVSGIWQTVWLEAVPENHIRSLSVKTEGSTVTVTVRGGEAKKTLSLKNCDGGENYSFSGDSFSFTLKDLKLWSPEEPNIYRFTLESGADSVESYFAVRTLTLEKRGQKTYICLNGKPYFFNGLLDQGYFSDGIYLPGTPRGYEDDILKMKAMGFNMLRKHIKIEPQIFYYYCDIYGMAVFQDMVNSGKYSFVIDTALPTAGLVRGISHRAGEKRREIFEDQCRKTVELLSVHPSVCYYTIFNEGWGQYDADRIYRELKALDVNCVWDTAS
ncbi:MAG: MFS transporter, partial [Clostridia bacterium]|nr:MFS transporter [Clostridia bacterium]